MESDSSQTSSIPSSSINDAEIEPAKQKSESFMPLQGPLAQEKQTELDETEENPEEKQKIVDLQDPIDAGQRENVTGLEEQNQSKAQEIIQVEETVKEKEELCEDSSQIKEKAPKNLIRRFFAWKKEKSEVVAEKDNKITKLKQEIETCKNEAEKALQEKQKIIDLQDQIIAGKQDKVTDLEQQKIQFQKVVKEKEEIIDGQASTIKEEKSEKAKIQIAHQEENNQLKNEIAALNSKVGESDAAVTQKEKQLVELEAYKEAKALEIEQLKQTLLDRTKSCDDLVAENAQTKNENAKLLRKSSALQEEKAQLNDEIASLKTKVEESDAAIRQMESKVLEKANQIIELQETNSKLLNPNDIVTVHRLNNLSPVDIILESIFRQSQSKTFLTSYLCYHDKKWLDGSGIEVRLDDSFCKIFVQDLLKIKSIPATEFSSFIDRLHPKSFCGLYLEDLTISSENFKNLIGKSNIRRLKIDRITVTDEDGTLITVDQLMKEVPNVERFDYIFNDGESMKGLAQKLVELPQFTNLRLFLLNNLQEGFDLEAFGQFIMKNAIKDGDWMLQFKVPKETFAELERIQKEILSTLPSSFCLQIHNGDT